VAGLIVHCQGHPVQSCLPLSAIPWGHTRSREGAESMREASPVAIFLRFLLTSVRGHWVKSLLILGCLLIEMGFNASISMSFKFLIDRAVIPQNMHVLWLIPHCTRLRAGLHDRRSRGSPRAGGTRGWGLLWGDCSAAECSPYGHCAYAHSVPVPDAAA